MDIQSMLPFQADETLAMQRLANKIAIVTGASQGIGRAVANRFYSEGANLVLSSLPEDGAAEDVIRQINASEERVLVVEGDLRQRNFVDQLFEETEKRFGLPHIVAAIAGVNMNRPMID